jgi:hypothetical protein
MEATIRMSWGFLTAGWGFHELILLTDDDVWQIWIGRLTFHMDESSNAL